MFSGQRFAILAMFKNILAPKYVIRKRIEKKLLNVESDKLRFSAVPSNHFP